MWHENNSVDEPYAPVLVGLLVGDGILDLDTYSRIAQSIATSREVHGAELDRIELERIVDESTAASCGSIEVTIEKELVARTTLDVIGRVGLVDHVTSTAIDRMRLTVSAHVRDLGSELGRTAVTLASSGLVGERQCRIDVTRQESDIDIVGARQNIRYVELDIVRIGLGGWSDRDVLVVDTTVVGRLDIDRDLLGLDTLVEGHVMLLDIISQRVEIELLFGERPLREVVDLAIRALLNSAPGILVEETALPERI